MMEIDYKEPLDSFVEQIDVHELLPQREPFIMIGSLCHFDMARTSADNQDIFYSTVL